MGAKQGLENVVDAARLAQERNERVQFVLVGDGSERQKLIERAAGLTHVTFVDPLQPDEFLLALAAADVLIVNEKVGVSEMAVPSKLTSYFSAGRPIVAATDPEGITASEVLDAAAGVVVDAGNPVALLDAVVGITQCPEDAEKFSQNGRTYRNTVLDQTVALDQWRMLLASLISD